MQKITDRVHDFTGHDGCYSLDVERALKWDSLTPDEGQKLLRYAYLCKKHDHGDYVKKNGNYVKEFLTDEEKKEWWTLNDFVIKNDLDLSIIPEQLLR